MEKTPPEKRAEKPPTSGSACISGSPIDHAHISYYYYSTKCTGCAGARDDLHLEKRAGNSNFRLRMRASEGTLRVTLPSVNIVTSGDITSGCARDDFGSSTTSFYHKCYFVRDHILLQTLLEKLMNAPNQICVYVIYVRA